MSGFAEPIVITGAGLNSCLGLNRREVFEAVRQGRCGIGPLTELEQPAAQRDGGQSPPLGAEDDADQPREVRYLRRAIREALREAGFTAEAPWDDPSRVGVVLGTTLAGMRAGGKYLRSGDHVSLGEFLAANTLERALEGLAIDGPGMTTCAACASGLSAIAMGMTLLRRGELDVVIAGGYDPVSEYVYAGFNSLRLITEGPPLPFSKHRQGMKLGEGSGIVVLERAGDAHKRGVKPLAQVAGFGESSDAHHLTKPHPEGSGAAKAMNAALRDAGVDASAIDMIAAHATATPNNDAAEFAAYQHVFGERLARLPVTAFKSHLGHTLGGAGAVELILSMMSMHESSVPPVANVQADDVEFDGLDLVTGSQREATINHTMNLSLGFGGANGCVILGRADALQQPASVTGERGPGHEVCITGVGVIVPGCVGNEAFIERLSDAGNSGLDLGGAIDEAALLPLFTNARRLRRFSAYVKYLLAATNVALRDAGLDSEQHAALIEQSCAFLGSMQGTVDFTDQYYRQVVEEGIDAANPMLFAEGVPNVASAQLSLMLNLRGCSQTVIGSRTAGLDALHMATQRIACGASEHAIVGAAEEYGELINQAYGACGLCHADQSIAAKPFADGGGFVTGAGAVVLILESREAASQRGAQVLGTIAGSCSVRSQGRDQLARGIERVMDTLGRPSHVISSANNTWIDRLEARAMLGGDDQPTLSAIYGHVPEMFAVTPLAALASVILSRRVPRLIGAVDDLNAQTPASGLEQPPRVAVLGSDYSGTVAAVNVQLPSR